MWRGVLLRLLLRNDANGTVNEGEIKAADVQRNPSVVKTTVSYINKVLGTELSRSEMEKIFDRLGFTVDGSKDELIVTVPNRRWDISIPADLVEEVAKEEAEKPAEIKVAEKEYVYKKPEDDGFKVERTGEHSFVVTGNKLERLVQRTNLDHTDGIMLLARKLKRMGVDDALREKGAVNGDDVSIADFTFEFVD